MGPKSRARDASRAPTHGDRRSVAAAPRLAPSGAPRLPALAPPPPFFAPRLASSGALRLASSPASRLASSGARRAPPLAPRLALSLARRRRAPPVARWLALGLVLALAGCGGAGDETRQRRDEEGAQSGPPAEPASCGTACAPGLGKLRFVNASGALRRVHVDDALSCEIEADEACVVEVPEGDEAMVHVTDAHGAPVCKDAKATVAACVCVTFRIRC